MTGFLARKFLQDYCVKSSRKEISPGVLCQEFSQGNFSGRFQYLNMTPVTTMLSADAADLGVKCDNASRLPFEYAESLLYSREYSSVQYVVWCCPAGSGGGGGGGGWRRRTAH